MFSFLCLLQKIDIYNFFIGCYMFYTWLDLYINWYIRIPFSEDIYMGWSLTKVKSTWYKYLTFPLFKPFDFKYILNKEKTLGLVYCTICFILLIVSQQSKYMRKHDFAVGHCKMRTKPIYVSFIKLSPHKTESFEIQNLLFVFGTVVLETKTLKKSRIREKLNISTDAVSSNDTKRDLILFLGGG